MKNTDGGVKKIMAINSNHCSWKLQTRPNCWWYWIREELGGSSTIHIGREMLVSADFHKFQLKADISDRPEERGVGRGRGVLLKTPRDVGVL